MDLLLLVDASKQSIEKYIHKSEVYVVVENGDVFGVYTLWKFY